MWEYYPHRLRRNARLLSSNAWGFFPQKICYPVPAEELAVALEIPPFLPPQGNLLLKALTRLLRPLVRLAIGSGVTFPVLSSLLRALYVEVAAGELLPEPRTDSRISLLTGVHRKEIRRLRGHATDPDEVPMAVTLGSQIIARWVGAPGYVDAAGQPVPLPRNARPGLISFEALVEAITTDLRARAVLDEWLSQGIVALDGAGQVVLNSSAFIPRPGREEQMFYFARNLHDHLAAATANLLATGAAPFPDLSVHYDGLGPEAASRLEAQAREGAKRLLLDINRIALALVDEQDRAAPAHGQPRRRVNLGVYLYAADERPGQPGDAAP